QAGRIGQWLAGGQRPRLAKDPGVANRPAGGGDSVNARLADHIQAGLRREKISAAKHHAGTCVSFDFAQEFPAAGTNVLLLDRPPMHRDGRGAALKGAVEDLKKVVAALQAIVE